MCNTASRTQKAQARFLFCASRCPVTTGFGFLTGLKITFGAWVQEGRGTNGTWLQDDGTYIMMMGHDILSWCLINRHVSTSLLPTFDKMLRLMTNPKWIDISVINGDWSRLASSSRLHQLILQRAELGNRFWLFVRCGMFEINDLNKTFGPIECEIVPINISMNHAHVIHSAKSFPASVQIFGWSKVPSNFSNTMPILGHSQSSAPKKLGPAQRCQTLDNDQVWNRQESRAPNRENPTRKMRFSYWHGDRRRKFHWDLLYSTWFLSGRVWNAKF